MNPIVILAQPDELPERDPNCELCQHEWFTPHLHRDGSARIFSRDAQRIYILQMMDGKPTCTCPNGQHTEPGKTPRCWHVPQYRLLIEDRDRIDDEYAMRGIDMRSRRSLENIFE